MKKVTVSFTVDDSYHVSGDKLRWLKDDMIVAGMERVESESLQVLQINATIGTVRKVKERA